jgi:hypothetical protein
MFVVVSAAAVVQHVVPFGVDDHLPDPEVSLINPKI